ncbi:MAG: hypothetical protein RLZZ262_2418 [Bacteroidota bacterium]
MKALIHASSFGARLGGILLLLFVTLIGQTGFAQFNSAFDFSPTVMWSSYTGGENYDDTKQIIADYGGSVYAVGMISEGESIADLAFLNTYGGGLSDAYITKRNPDGEVQWSLFIGGASSDFGTAICELPDGNILVGGYTSSIGDIAIDGSQTTYGGGISDGFIALIDPDGSQISSSYIGGTGRDVIVRLVSSPDQRIFFCGNTNTSSLAYPMIHQDTYGGGTSDGFMGEIMSTGEVVWASYVGGSFADFVTDIAVSNEGNLHFVGRGGPSALISSMDSPILGGGISDGFVGVLNNEGLVWTKYIGGINYDAIEGVAISPSGATVIVGSTNSDEIEALDSFTGITNNNYDIIVATFSDEGELLWHEILGGDGNDTPAAVAVDVMGNVFLGANSESAGLETINPLFDTPVGGADMFMARWNASGTKIWASYMGGMEDDFCTDIAIDRLGKVVYSGYSESSALYGTPAGVEYNGGWDGIVSRIMDCDNPEVEIHELSDTVLCEGSTAEFCAGGAQHYQWFNLDTVAITDTQEPGYVYAIGYRDNGCLSVSNRIEVQVLPRPEVEAVAFGPTIFCGTGTVYMEATGAPEISWNNGDEGFSTTITEAGTYYATGTAENGCRDTSPGIEVIFVEDPEMTFAVGDSELCIEGGVEALVGLPEGGVFEGNGVVGNVFDPMLAGGGTHEVYYSFQDDYGCYSNSDTIQISVFYPPVLMFDAIDTLCLLDSPVDLLGLPVGGYFSGDGIIGSTFNPGMSGTGPQNITYTYIDSYGCANNAYQLITVDACTAIEELNDESLYFSVYPNPATDVFNMKFKAHIQYTCRLMSTTGQLVDQWICKDFYSYNATDLANGMYYLQVESEGWIYTHKLQISR